MSENQCTNGGVRFGKMFFALLFMMFFANSGMTNTPNASENHSETVEHDHSSMQHHEAATSANHEADAVGHSEISSAHAESHEAEGFEPGKMIMEHIADAHDWHLWGDGDHAVSIPLPVILYTGSKGLTVFSSSNFHHGHASYEGFKLSHEGIIMWEDASNSESIYDFSLTKNVLALLIGSIFLIILVVKMARHYAANAGKAPKGVYNLIEPLILFLRDDIARPTIGKKADNYMPLLLSIFFFIFTLNLFGLIPVFPGGANVTGNISVTMVLALVVFVTVTFSGNKYYWKHIFMPDVPVWMYVIIIPIEILGVILKPFVLMLRLFANITAGHIIILGFFSLIFIFGNMSPNLGYAVSPLSVAFTVFMSMLELLVAFLQAFVFTLLSSIYIGMAVEEHHH
jgi:F-type H+-transporting ATPase subunit a